MFCTRMLTENFILLKLSKRNSFYIPLVISHFRPRRREVEKLLKGGEVYLPIQKKNIFKLNIKFLFYLILNILFFYYIDRHAQNTTRKMISKAFLLSKSVWIKLIEYFKNTICQWKKVTQHVLHINLIFNIFNLFTNKRKKEKQNTSSIHLLEKIWKIRDSYSGCSLISPVVAEKDAREAYLQ